MSARIAGLSALFAMSFLAVAPAEEPDKPAISDPVVFDNQFSWYDLANVKAGQWLKYETKMEMGGAQMPATTWVMACVESDEKTGQGYKVTMSLVAWGQQASRSLRLAGDPKDFKPAELSPEEVEKPEPEKPEAPTGKKEKEE